MSQKLISIIQVAEELGRQKQYIFKLVNRLKIEKVMQKSSGARGQTITYISIDDLERIKEHLLTSSQANSSTPEVSFESATSGVFYLIQLEPEHDKGRFKLGFATNLDERLRSHKTAAPFSTVINSWPCKLLWEKTAIDSITQGCERIYTEVFRHDSIDEIEERCERFFALMPSPEIGGGET
ncbi:hypothetical protein PN836_018640 [Ningiella sp. W23]|uniref:hypothetical protein n=1 Tax=Ningiella sp. W23 TaxID=3023715 RepID=UPI003757F786